MVSHDRLTIAQAGGVADNDLLFAGKVVPGTCLPDRIIAAAAWHHCLPLVTRDRKIRACGIETIW
jgi:predicted nucleic acid-binding protein